MWLFCFFASVITYRQFSSSFCLYRWMIIVFGPKDQETFNNGLS